jgi:hypothetical protein
VDDGFPVVTFHFEGDLSLDVHPHDYLFQNGVINHKSCLVFREHITSNIASTVLTQNSIVVMLAYVVHYFIYCVMFM